MSLACGLLAGLSFLAVKTLDFTAMGEPAEAVLSIGLTWLTVLLPSLGLA